MKGKVVTVDSTVEFPYGETVLKGRFKVIDEVMYGDVMIYGGIMIEDYGCKNITVGENGTNEAGKDNLFWFYPEMIIEKD